MIKTKIESPLIAKFDKTIRTMNLHTLFEDIQGNIGFVTGGGSIAVYLSNGDKVIGWDDLNSVGNRSCRLFCGPLTITFQTKQ